MGSKALTIYIFGVGAPLRGRLSRAKAHYLATLPIIRIIGDSMCLILLIIVIMNELKLL